MNAFPTLQSQTTKTMTINNKRETYVIDEYLNKEHQPMCSFMICKDVVAGLTMDEELNMWTDTRHGQCVTHVSIHSDAGCFDQSHIATRNICRPEDETGPITDNKIILIQKMALAMAIAICEGQKDVENLYYGKLCYSNGVPYMHFIVQRANVGRPEITFRYDRHAPQDIKLIS